MGTGGGQAGSKGLLNRLGLEKGPAIENAQNPVPARASRTKAGGGHSSEARPSGPDAIMVRPGFGPSPCRAEVAWGPAASGFSMKTTNEEGCVPRIGPLCWGGEGGLLPVSNIPA